MIQIVARSGHLACLGFTVIHDRQLRRGIKGGIHALIVLTGNGIAVQIQAQLAALLDIHLTAQLDIGLQIVVTIIFGSFAGVEPVLPGHFFFTMLAICHLCFLNTFSFKNSYVNDIAVSVSNNG